jgi:hypothetical protein
MVIRSRPQRGHRYCSNSTTSLPSQRLLVDVTNSISWPQLLQVRGPMNALESNSNSISSIISLGKIHRAGRP